MKIETKFGIGDTVYFLRPEDWDWMDSGKTRRVVEQASIKRITQEEELEFLCYSPEGEEGLSFFENELYATEEEAQKACTAWNKLHGFGKDETVHDMEECLNEGFDDALKEVEEQKSFYSECLKVLNNINEKLDMLTRKEKI